MRVFLNKSDEKKMMVADVRRDVVSRCGVGE